MLIDRNLEAFVGSGERDSIVKVEPVLGLRERKNSLGVSIQILDM